MKTETLVMYLLVLLAGFVAGLCTPGSWYASPAPTAVYAPASTASSQTLASQSLPPGQ